MPPADRRRNLAVGGRGSRLGYRPELDGLRGLAVLAVMAFHCGLRRVFPGGFLGVDLFFVLSGFLITALVLRESQQAGRVRLPRFYLRRALRLLPALLLVLAACCAWAALRTKPDRAAVIYRAAALTACHAANAAPCWSIPMDCLGHAWSLSVEEQFYLIWPLLLVMLLRRGARPRTIARLVAAGIIASAAVRAALWLGPWPGGAAAAATSLPARADALLAGCLVGLLASAGRLPQRPGAPPGLRIAAGLSSLFLLLLGMTAQTGAPWLYLGGFTAVAAAAAVVVAALVNSPPRTASRLLGAPPLIWTGRISYGLYLWHFPLLSVAPKLIHSLVPATRHIPGLDAPLAYLLALGAAALSYYVVERPCLRWKDRLGGAPSPHARGSNSRLCHSASDVRRRISSASSAAAGASNGGGVRSSSSVILVRSISANSFMSGGGAVGGAPAAAGARR